MGINLRRGLLRTWIVGSVVWIVGASVVAYSQLQDDFAVLSGDQPTAQQLIKCDETTDQSLRPLCDFQDQLRGAMRKLDEPRYLERREQAWSHIRWAAAAVIGPPILTLLVAIAGFWVIRGFR